MAYYSVKDSTLVNIADAIREKTGKTDGLKPDEMAGEIAGITGGNGIDTSDATAQAGDILQSKTAYVDGERITGTIETFDGSYECSGESTGGGSGGASVGTCTITISDNQNCASAHLIYTVLNNAGEIDGVFSHNVSLPQTIDNVVCGSVVYLHRVSMFNPSGLTSDDCSLIYCSGAYGIAFRAPIDNGAISNAIIANLY